MTSITARDRAASRAVARRYAGRGVSLAELERLAHLGLTTAAERCDPSRQHDFLTFAVPWMCRLIRRHLQDQTWAIRPPRHGSGLDSGSEDAHDVRDVHAVRAAVDQARLLLDPTIRALSPRDRYVLRRTCLDGWTPAETAAELGLSERSVSMMLGRIVACLATGNVDAA